MCCQYYFTEKTKRELEELEEDADNLREYGSGIIRPSDPSLVLSGRREKLTLEVMNFGFVNARTGSLLINARSESVFERPSFCESVLRRRCVIAADHFYEWDRQKQKVTLSLAGEDTVYMAAIYNRFGDYDHFTILTREANASMAAVHDRMPILLDRREIRKWILDPSFTKEAFCKEAPAISRYQEYEQLSLFSF